MILSNKTSKEKIQKEIEQTLVRLSMTIKIIKSDKLYIEENKKASRTISSRSKTKI